MSDRAGQADLGEATLDATLARWSADPALSSLFETPDGIVLVLDAGGERVLHASEAGRPLRAAIANPDGRPRDALHLPEQIRRACATGSGARLARIRFDARGLARPTACLIARAFIADDQAAVLVAPTEPLPVLRPITLRAQAEAVPTPLPEPAAEERSVPSGRIVWRSNADGVLTHVSGASPEVAACISGQSWRTLGENGVAVGEPLLAAIEARQTFRALALLLRTPGAEHELELSGAPSARQAQPFAGFSGFGLVRGHRALPEECASRPPAAQHDEPPSGSSEAALAPASEDPMSPVFPQEQGEAPQSQPSVAAQLGSSWGGQDLLPTPSIERTPVAPETIAARHGTEAPDPTEEGGEERTPDAGSQPQKADLSTQEHAAFREIARALGARFAGDDEPPQTPEQVLDTERRGAVMAFPTSAAQNASTAIDAAIVAALDRLPAGVLVHRDAAILFVNRRLLDLTGYPDRAAMQAAGGLDPLLNRRLQDDGSSAPDVPVSVTTETGKPMDLMIERSKVDWDGGPAELLLVRAASEAERAREQIAQGLFEARDATRERDSLLLLDHIEEGVATLDENGRILGLNRSAAAILSSEAREIVGGTLADLFTPDSGLTIATSLSEARETGTSEPREATPRAVAHHGPLRLRIARFSTASTRRFCATLREPAVPGPTAGQPHPSRVEPESVRRVDFLARVGHEIRTPLNGIVRQAGAMLGEKRGPLGSEHDRESLRDIQASGEHLLGVFDDLLDLARIEAGRVDLAFTDVALNDVVSGCIALMQPQAARDRIVVRTSLSPDLGPLLADERSMRQATLHVIANAIRLSEAGGQVIVSTTTAERGEIAFRVRDNGIGMSPEEIENALEPFRRTELADGRNGAGLGLTLTKALVEANRGRFHITSRKNEGTLVEMLFAPPQALSA